MKKNRFNIYTFIFCFLLLAFYFWLWIKKRAAKKIKNDEAKKPELKRSGETSIKSEQATEKTRTEQISEKNQNDHISETERAPQKTQIKQISEKVQAGSIPEKSENRETLGKNQIGQVPETEHDQGKIQTEQVTEKNKNAHITEKSETGQAHEKRELNPIPKEHEAKKVQTKEPVHGPSLTLIVVPADYSGNDVSSLLPRDVETIGNDYLPVNSKLHLRKECFSVYVNEECRAAFVVGLDYHSYSVSLSAYEISRLVSVIDPEKPISPVNKSLKKHASKYAFLKIPDEPQHYYSGTSWVITCSSKNHEANFIMADYHSRPLRVPVNELTKIYEMVK